MSEPIEAGSIGIESGRTAMSLAPRSSLVINVNVHSLARIVARLDLGGNAFPRQIWTSGADLRLETQVW